MTTAGRAGRGATASLMLGALGVVFGDIGTSPLYALQTVFALDDGIVQPTTANVFGVVSLVFWSITLIVSAKYLGFILRADNDGEGGVMALAHLAARRVRVGSRAHALILILGVFGGSLFFGDSLITPAISVLSAVEGLDIAVPGTERLVVPIAATVIALLFAVQRFGTHRVGPLFGPVMVLWFLTLGVLGLVHVVADPAVLTALSPHHAVTFFVRNPGVAFVAMGASVLAITGAEALYADLGHFGRVPIMWAWFALAFPCLTLNYLGQAQLIMRDTHEIASPFFHLAPDWAQLPLVVLATMATIIASQAVISGAFSVARQAERLGFLPRLTVRQTSDQEGGQIYIPSVNWLLFAGVLGLLLIFRSSERLATAYGVAVTTDLMLTSTLFCVYAVTALRWRWPQVALFVAAFSVLEVAYFSANIAKVLHGGWLPLAVALGVATLMSTWSRGRELVTARREKLEGPLVDFLEQIHDDSKILRVPGTAIFLHPSKATTPLALRENVQFNHVVHDDVFIVSTQSLNVPHVPDDERVIVDDLGDPYDHITHITLRYGFSDHQDVPAGLAVARDEGLGIDLDKATYFLSRIALRPSDRPGMGPVRKRVFVALARNAADPTEYFRLPVAQTVITGARVNF
ncbi:potassium transporter Kup [Ornithinimicrobium faecis]|uniref:Probable potassium transport system protein Kup n=1 Tax=Ornithinimicrobium faecis TaxID=2934158 RepID=A0ABY4YRH2_9MICO|nr:potassium transporter Kup [Ornithinimicrobium sp. HY1793]USQ78762.1 potassium transporter Kup [Ornithinimicrobium sp. HY1793]